MAGTERTGRIGAVEYQDGTISVDQDELLRVMTDMAGTLRTVGGMFAVTADRVQVGEENGKPVGETTGYVWHWRAFSPMRRGEQPPAEDADPHEQPVEAPAEPVEA
jgi:hypothetical protein